jgi:hypothetical protein
MSEPWRPTRETAYRAAELVLTGKCAAQIADTLYAHHGPVFLARVRRLLEFAASKGLLTLHSPINDDLQIKLRERFGPELSFCVVNNDQAAYSENPKVDDALRADAVGRQAAGIFADRIHQLLLKKTDPRKPIIIANAGGLAVSRLVRFLSAQKLIPEEADTRRLLFISLNSASMPTDYGRSANTLAVRMAEIYGGRHITLCPIWPKTVASDYEHAVRNIDLLVCGAGAEHGLLFTWLKDNAAIGLPPGAIGDLCLIPISAQGNEVPLERRAPQRVRQILNPHPTYLDLQALASRDAILYVAVGNQNDDRRPDLTATPRQFHSKLAVTRAILRHTLARTCVLGATLARDLLEPD